MAATDHTHQEQFQKAYHAVAAGEGDAVRMPDILKISDCVRGMEKDVRQLAGTIREIADRLYGSDPAQQPEDVCKTPPVAGTIAGVHEDLSELRVGLDLMGHEIQRLADL